MKRFDLVLFVHRIMLISSSIVWVLSVKCFWNTFRLKGDAAVSLSSRKKWEERYCRTQSTSLFTTEGRRLLIGMCALEKHQIHFVISTLKAIQFKKALLYSYKEIAKNCYFGGLLFCLRYEKYAKQVLILGNIPLVNTSSKSFQLSFSLLICFLFFFHFSFILHFGYRAMQGKDAWSENTCSSNKAKGVKAINVPRFFETPSYCVGSRDDEMSSLVDVGDSVKSQPWREDEYMKRH